MYNFKNVGGSFKLHFNNVQYYVNEEKRRVTAVADVSCSIPEALGNIIFNHCLPNGCNPFAGPLKYSYTAICAPGDVFDEEKGKKIARAGMETKAYRGMSKRLSKWYSRFYIYVSATLYTQCTDFFKKAKNAEEHNNRYIKEKSSI